MMKKKTFSVAISGLLAAFAIAVSFLETIIPTAPLLPPGIKIGFSNVAVMIAAKNVSFSSAISVSILKSLFVLVTRGFTAFLLSLAGGLASTAAVILIFRDKKSRFGCVGAGLIGAEVHNTAQIAVYSLFIGKAAFYYLPVLLCFGAACGALTGITLYLIEKLLKSDVLYNNYLNASETHGKDNINNG